MSVQKLSTCIITDKVDECRSFYEKYFNAAIRFDCGWYIDLQLGDESATLQFKEPGGEDKRCPDTGGIVFNILVKDVDGEHDRLTSAGLKSHSPLKSNPWGDRSFAVRDPNGIELYIYSEIEPSEEFKQYFK